MEADGGSRGNPGAAAYGAVVIVDGAVVRELAGTIGVASNNVAEYRSVLAALGGSPRRLRIRSRWRCGWTPNSWWSRCPDGGRSTRTCARWRAKVRAAYPPELVRYQWIPRERNQRADALVNEALDARVSTIDRRPLGI